MKRKFITNKLKKRNEMRKKILLPLLPPLLLVDEFVVLFPTNKKIKKE
jgi:hypothetical protein